MGVSCCNGLVIFAHVVCPICDHAASILVGLDLVQEIGQQGSISEVTASDLDSPNLQRLFVNSDVNLTPNKSL